MARAAGSRAASAKAETKEVKVNGTGAPRGRPKKTEDAPKTNGTADAALPKSKTDASVKAATRAEKSIVTGRGRPKKDATPAVESAPPSASLKRKASEDSGAQVTEEPEAKKTKVDEPKTGVKTTKKPKEPLKPQPLGPRRLKGKKNEINAIRYTEPLKVFLCGEGSSGELGFGATRKAIDVKRPRYNEALTNQNVVKIATGGMHVVALTQDNRILTWGVNDNGALGRDTSNADVKMRDLDADDDSDSEDESGGLNDLESTPTAISADYFPDDTVFVDVAAGDSCSFALTTEGAVYGWGTFRKNEGILGFQRGNNTARFPTYIDGVTKITQIACGTNHVLALDDKRHVYAWGNGQQNQLGRRVTERTLTESLQPNRVGFHDSAFKRPSQRIAQIACGDYHGLAIAEDGHIWSWGVNNYCETGYPMNAGADDASVLTPKIIASLENKNVVSVHAGAHHNMAVTKDGQVITWGRCDGSQSGIPAEQLNAIEDEERVLKNHGQAKILIEPTVIPNLSNIVTASCGPDHTIAIDSNGKAWSWGFSANYQTGQGTDEDIKVPTMIDNTATRDVKLIYAGCGGQYSVVASKK